MNVGMWQSEGGLCTDVSMGVCVSVCMKPEKTAEKSHYRKADERLKLISRRRWWREGG